MKINTRFFGELEYKEQEVFRFTQGMPGLESFRNFVLVALEEGVPFSYMQSVDEGSLAFLVTDPFQYFQDYDLSLNDATRTELSIESASDVEVWTIVTVNKDMTEATVNLLAPIIVNSKKKLAKQIILHDSSYKVRQKLPLAVGEKS